MHDHRVYTEHDGVWEAAVTRAVTESDVTDAGVTGPELSEEREDTL